MTSYSTGISFTIENLRS